MRFCAAFLLVGTLTAGEAAASSFVAPREIKGGLSRSIVVLGTPDAATPKLASVPREAEKPPRAALAYPLPRPETRPVSRSDVRVISASIIAMGEPAVTFEKVAAIEPKKKSRRRPASLPMVIRGGIIGDAFISSAPALAPAAPEPQQEVVEAPHKSPARPVAPQVPSPQPAAPPPAPPPPPTPQLPQLRGVE